MNITRRVRASILGGLALTLAACAPEPPSYEATLVDSTHLRNYLVPEGEPLVGLTIDPDSGARHIVYLSRFSDLTLASTATLRKTVLWADAGRFRPTDIVALGEGRYAVLGVDGGYLADVASGTAVEHFCFLPGASEGEWPAGQRQTARALAFDPSDGRLWAQPRTFEGAELLRSELAAFDASSGDELGWWPIDDEIEATGMAALPGEVLLYADGTKLVAWSRGTGMSSTVIDLGTLGVQSVAAMVWDPTTGHTLVLDEVTRTVFELDVGERTD